LEHHVELQVVAIDELVHVVERRFFELAVAPVAHLARSLDGVTEYPAAHHAILDAEDRDAPWLEIAALLHTHVVIALHERLDVLRPMLHDFIPHARAAHQAREPAFTRLAHAQETHHVAAVAVEAQKLVGAIAPHARAELHALVEDIAQHVAVG